VFSIILKEAESSEILDLRCWMQPSDLAPLDADPEGIASNRGPPLLGAVEKDSSVSSPYPIIGKRRSHIYHRPDCPNYSQVAPHNRVEFNSAAEAARYRVAGNCS